MSAPQLWPCTYLTYFVLASQEVIRSRAGNRTEESSVSPLFTLRLETFSLAAHQWVEIHFFFSFFFYSDIVLQLPWVALDVETLQENGRRISYCLICHLLLSIVCFHWGAQCMDTYSRGLITSKKKKFNFILCVIYLFNGILKLYLVKLNFSLLTDFA